MPLGVNQEHEGSRDCECSSPLADFSTARPCKLKGPPGSIDGSYLLCHSSELYNISAWKGPIEIINSNTLLLSGIHESNNITESIIQMLFLEALHCDHFSGEPLLVADHLLSEEHFPDMQPEFCPMQLYSIPIRVVWWTNMSTVMAHIKTSPWKQQSAGPWCLFQIPKTVQLHLS